MTSIKIENLWTTIHSNDKEVIDTARKIASYTMSNWQIRRQKWLERLQAERKTNTPEYQRALDWDGTVFIGSSGRGWIRIPTGCIKTLIRTLSVMGKTVSYNDDRKRPVEIDVQWHMRPDIELRDYQIEAVESLKKNAFRGIVQAPTGSGKTVLMGSIISHTRTTTLIVVPNLTLLKQINKELLNKTTIKENDIGMIGGRKYDPSLITIITSQSLISARKDPVKWREIMGIQPQGWGLLIMDECHHAGADGTWNVVMNIDTFYRVGLSATALMREDGENIKIVAAFGDIIHEVPHQPLIEDGWLIRPKITFLPVQPVATTRNEKWADVYNNGIVYNFERNRQIIMLANELNREGRSTLIFVDRIQHGDELMTVAERFADHEIRFVHGQHEERDDIITAFKSGRLKTMISTEGIIGEGFDYRDLDAIIVADGGKSVIQAIQKVGRGMRIATFNPLS